MSDVNKLFEVFIAPFERIETALTDLYLQMRVYSSTGIMLDRIGAMVGEPRQDRDDQTYRRTISARIAINKSRGTHEEIIRIALALLRPTGSRVNLQHGDGVAIVETMNDPVTLQLANLMATYLKQAVPLTVRLGVLFTNAGDETFEFSDGDTYQADSNGFGADDESTGGHFADIAG